MEHVVLDFCQLVADSIPVVDNIDSRTHVRASLPLRVAHQQEYHLFTRLPIGIFAFFTSFTGPLSRIVSPKWIILTGLSLCSVATVLLALGGANPENYWPYIFPAFSLGTTGGMLTYSHTK